MCNVILLNYYDLYRYGTTCTLPYIFIHLKKQDMLGPCYTIMKVSILLQGCTHECRVQVLRCTLIHVPVSYSVYRYQGYFRFNFMNPGSFWGFEVLRPIFQGHSNSVLCSALLKIQGFSAMFCSLSRGSRLLGSDCNGSEGSGDGRSGDVVKWVACCFVHATQRKLVEF